MPQGKTTEGMALALQQREAGSTAARRVVADFVHTRRSLWQLSGCKLFSPVHHGNINALALDSVESRYLLAGAGDTTIAVYDTKASSNPDSADDSDLQPMFVLHRSKATSHAYMVSSVSWYPVDTGLFVTGAYDNTVKVWDTNTQDVLASFSLPAKVSCVALSNVATTHCLLGVSCLEHTLRLCDPTSGALTHSLAGHREPVWCVAWSMLSEHQLLSGDASGAVRLWDIRRSGCIALLDQFNTQREPSSLCAHAEQGPSQHDRGASGSVNSRTTQAQSSSRRREASPSQHSPMGQPKRRKVEAAAAKEPEGLAITTSPAAAAKTSMQERGLGPLDSRKAHNGAVTCILPTQDGLHLLTAGNDDRMQLWNATHLHSQIVNYPHARNRARKARQCALTDDSRILFFPSGNGVQVYETLTGKLITSLAHGHYDAVNCCAYNADLEELYTGANDNRILAWHVAAAGLDFDDAADADNAEQDDWGD